MNVIRLNAEKRLENVIIVAAGPKKITQKSSNRYSVYRKRAAPACTRRYLYHRVERRARARITTPRRRRRQRRYADVSTRTVGARRQR